MRSSYGKLHNSSMNQTSRKQKARDIVKRSMNKSTRNIILYRSLDGDFFVLLAKPRRESEKENNNLDRKAGIVHVATQDRFSARVPIVQEGPSNVKGIQRGTRSLSAFSPGPVDATKRAIVSCVVVQQDGGGQRIFLCIYIFPSYIGWVYIPAIGRLQQTPACRYASRSERFCPILRQCGCCIRSGRLCLNWFPQTVFFFFF